MQKVKWGGLGEGATDGRIGGSMTLHWIRRLECGDACLALLKVRPEGPSDMEVG